MKLLPRLEELDKAATPGPWSFDHGTHDIWTTLDAPSVVDNVEEEPDGDLIVHLRNHVPEIIALVKAARKYRDHLNSPYLYTRLLAALEALDK